MWTSGDQIEEVPKNKSYLVYDLTVHSFYSIVEMLSWQQPLSICVFVSEHPDRVWN